MKIALVGKGYWGSKLLKYFNENDYFDVIKVYDSKSVLDYSEVEAVVVATPIDTHYEVIKTALKQGCDVFTEKPIAKTVERTEELIALAKKKGVVLCVDLTWTFSPRIKKIAACFKRPLRENADDNYDWRLLPHALSIIDMFDGLDNYTIETSSMADSRKTTITIDLDHEKDNLKYAVDYFYNVLIGKAKENHDSILKITKILCE